MYPCGEVYMAYVSSGIPLIWDVKVLHIWKLHIQLNEVLNAIHTIKTTDLAQFEAIHTVKLQVQQKLKP